MNLDPDRLDVYPCFEDTTECGTRMGETDLAELADAVCVERLSLEQTILDEIADPRMTRDDVAQTYAMLIRQADETCDWKRINGAIVKRWSKSALEYIKRRAWRMVLMCPWNEHPEGGDKDV